MLSRFSVALRPAQGVLLLHQATISACLRCYSSDHVPYGGDLTRSHHSSSQSSHHRVKEAHRRHRSSRPDDFDRRGHQMEMDAPPSTSLRSDQAVRVKVKSSKSSKKRSSKLPVDFDPAMRSRVSDASMGSKPRHEHFKESNVREELPHSLGSGSSKVKVREGSYVDEEDERLVNEESKRVMRLMREEALQADMKRREKHLQKPHNEPPVDRFREEYADYDRDEATGDDDLESEHEELRFNSRKESSKSKNRHSPMKSDTPVAPQSSRVSAVPNDVAPRPISSKARDVHHPPKSHLPSHPYSSAQAAAQTVPASSTHTAADNGPEADADLQPSGEPAVEPVVANDAVIPQELSKEQQRAVRYALQGRNLFITGGAGSGKSLVIREIVRQLRHVKRRNVFVTATTGVAALNVRGSTLNSFAGVKFGDGKARELLRWVRRNRRASGRWRYCQTLIIDEVSMMDPTLLDKLDVIARSIRHQEETPFGGIQVILCGDFLQLPPIPPRPQQSGIDEAYEEECNNNKEGMESRRHLRYCFESDTWKALNLTTIILHRKFRQNDDVAFQRVLDEVRVGCLSPESHQLLLSRTVTSKSRSKSRKKAGHSSEEEGAASSLHNPADTEKDRHVRLCATNKEVEVRNARHFSALKPRGLPNYAAPVPAISPLIVDGDDPRHSDGFDSVDGNDGHSSDAEALYPLQVYRAHDSYEEESNEHGEAIEGSPVPGSSQSSWVRFDDSTLPTDLALKVGTRVMLLQNISLRLGLVNGSVGEVVGFMHPLELVELVLLAPRERYKPTARGEELLRRGGFTTMQDAFRCIDTALGQSLFYSLRERSIRQPSEASYGKVYGNTHCLEVQRLVGLAKAEDDGTELNVHPQDMYLGCITPLQLRLMRLPVVRLDLRPETHPALISGQGHSGKHAGKPAPKHVYAFVSPSSHQWYMGDQVIASRSQIPLRQAWAMTVHKAQGLTISHVEIAIHRFFSPGQAYVALSRSPRLENIRLLNFSDSAVRACPVARDFYSSLREDQQDDFDEDSNERDCSQSDSGEYVEESEDDYDSSGSSECPDDESDASYGR
ncbi:DNA repair and recombination protein [Trypanosoma vivax]|nr:DNA repair and recombination protein [Trypanosoma vivax]